MRAYARAHESIDTTCRATLAGPTRSAKPILHRSCSGSIRQKMDRRKAVHCLAFTVEFFTKKTSSTVVRVAERERAAALPCGYESGAAALLPVRLRRTGKQVCYRFTLSNWGLFHSEVENQDYSTHSAPSKRCRGHCHGIRWCNHGGGRNRPFGTRYHDQTHELPESS